ncbi:MAG: MCE family protein [Bradymonadaceae bacterium]|nr:MCE family protein [Lujinxingiaceae bacterium]
MATRAQKMQLGIFVAVATALFVLTLVVLTGMQFWETRDEYTIRIAESVSGLEVGAPVKFRGVRVGTVGAIRVMPGNVEEIEIRVLVDATTPIKVDTEAVVSTQGITGLKYIELMSGTESAAELPSGGEIKAGLSVFDQLSGRAQDLSVKAEQLLNNLLVITRPENQQRLDSILMQVDTFWGHLNRLTAEIVETTVLVRTILEDNRAPINSAFKSIEQTSLSIQQVAVRVDDTLASMNTLMQRLQLGEAVAEFRETNRMVQSRLAELDVKQAVDDVSAALGALNILLENINQTVSQNQDQLRATLYNLRLASDSFKEFSRTLQNRPSRMFFDDQPTERVLP